MAKIAALIVALLVPVSAFAQAERTTADTLFIAALPTYGVLAALDAKGTVDCVRARICHEANPVLRPLVDRHGIEVAMGGKLAAQAGIAAFSAWAMHRWPHQKKYIVASFLTMTALQGVVVHLNHRTLERNLR